MIRVGPGAGFTTASDGDMRHDSSARSRLGIGVEWATVRQIHGNRVVTVDRPGEDGEADGLFTSKERVPLAVFTADCMGIVMHGRAGVAVIHAGWRGLNRGVIEAAMETMGSVDSVAIGPHIRSCCFEVGPEVAEHFGGHLSQTSWGTVSVDLAGAVTARLPVEPQVSDLCTRCGEDTFSHRRDATTARMAAVGWLA
jgi:polyphenol oxidase